MATDDPFAFDSQEFIPLVMKELPLVGKTPVSVKKKSPRVASSRKKEEDQEKKALKRAIEESKKTALREERARRYNKRMAQQKVVLPQPASGSETETDSCSNVCSPTQSLTTPPGKGKSRPNTSVLKLSPFVKDSTPTLEETAAAGVEEITENAVPCSKTATAPMETTPSKGELGTSSSGGRLNLKRKRLITSSKEPAIKLMKVDTGGVGKVATGGRSSPSDREVIKDSEAEIKEDRIAKHVVQENETMKTIAKEIVKEGVKETETVKDTVKQTKTDKETVKEKDTIKQALKEKEIIKQAVKKKETPVKVKEAVKEKDVVKSSIKKTAILTETVKKEETIKEVVKEKENGAVKEKDVIKEKEIVEQNEAVKGKEMIKGAAKEKETQAVKERETVMDMRPVKEVVKKREAVKEVKEKETVKRVVKDKRMVKEMSTVNDVHSDNTASPRPHKSLTLGGKKPTAHIEGKRTEVSAKKGQIDKTTVIKDKLLDPTNSLKTCPQLYAPRGTKPSEYMSVIMKFFENFKFQLRMAQSSCVTFVPWSLPAKTRQSRGDKYAERSYSKSSSALVLSSPVKQSQERKQHQDTVDMSPVQDWGHYIYGSDDQKLFNDSDYDIDPRSSQPASTFDCRQPSLPLDDFTDTVAASNSISRSPDKPTGVVSPRRRDVSINISSSDNSEVSSIITKKRRKRKPVGARLVADISGDIAATPEADNDRLSLTPSFSRSPLQPLSPQSPARSSQERQGVIDLTDETVDHESPSRPSTSANLRPLLNKQVACPICKQLFSETYIETHAANCDLHVEITVPPLTTSTQYRQTTLVGKPYKRLTPPSSTESDNEERYLPSTKKTNRIKKRKLLSNKTTSIPLDQSESDDIEAPQQEPSYLTSESDDIEAPQQEPSYLTRGNASAVDAIFESSDRFGQEMDDIASYSSEENKDATTENTRDTIIDYRNQFPALQMGKVSKELLTGDNTAFIEARQKKWMNSKRSKSYSRGNKKKWGKSRGRGRK